MSVAPSSTTALTQHKSVQVDGLEIFYREAGERANPTLLLLHGLPTSSRMFRNLIPALADRFHLVAPDYPGFGHSAFPSAEEFEYSFANLIKVVERFIEVVGLERFSIYIQDYGAPIGLSIASARPERVQAIITPERERLHGRVHALLGAAVRLRHGPQPRERDQGAPAAHPRGQRVAMGARHP